MHNSNSPLQTHLVPPHFFPLPLAAALSFLAKATRSSAWSFHLPALAVLPRGCMYHLPSPLPHTFGLFLSHYSRLLLLGTLELGTRLLRTPWPYQYLFPWANDKTEMEKRLIEWFWTGKSTDRVLLLLGTCFFLGLLLCRGERQLQGLWCPVWLTRALSRWLPRAMAQVEVSAMKGNRNASSVSSMASAMSLCLDRNPLLRVVWMKERKARCQHF